MKPVKSFHTADLLFLLAAFISFVLSVSLWFLSDRDQGLFVGMWVPSIIALGTYFRVILNGIVK